MTVIQLIVPEEDMKFWIWFFTALRWGCLIFAGFVLYWTVQLFVVLALL